MSYNIHVSFQLCVVVAAVFGVIIYRTTVSALLYAVDRESVKERAATITSITAACINLVIIIILSRVYLIIARILTNFGENGLSRPVFAYCSILESCKDVAKKFIKVYKYI